MHCHAPPTLLARRRQLTQPAAFHYLAARPGRAAVGHVSMMHCQFDSTGDDVQVMCALSGRRPTAPLLATPFHPAC